MLYEIITAGPCAHHAVTVLVESEDHAAPEVVDVEVTGLIRRVAHRRVLDATRSQWARDQLRDWPGDRFPHRPFIGRLCQLRDNVWMTDAFYVALAEALDVPLLTFDQRLQRASEVIVPGAYPGRSVDRAAPVIDAVLPGAMLTPWIRLSASGGFEEGKITVLVSMDGTFTWERRMRPGRPLSVYFTGGGVRSNTLTLR